MGSLSVFSRGRLTDDASELPGLVAGRDGRAVGYAMLRFEGDAGEVVVLHSLEQRRGVGAALLDGAREAAARGGCSRLWLITTNDNVRAIRFYERRTDRNSRNGTAMMPPEIASGITPRIASRIGAITP